MFRSTLGLALLAALATPAAAHDFWIRPSAWTVDPETSLTVQLLVGDHFEGAPYARNPDHIARFELVGPGGTHSVDGVPFVDPAGAVEVPSPGAHYIVYRSRHSLVELEAEAFEQYLEHEGLEHVIGMRAERGESDAPGREAFSRCAKALVCAGAGRHDGFDRTLGMRLELVPEANPYHLGTSRLLPVRLFHEGQPLADALVTAHHRDAAEVKIETRTDAEGRALLALPHAGEWMLNSVHMVPAVEGLDADWESLWASLSFGIPEGPEPSPSP